MQTRLFRSLPRIPTGKSPKSSISTISSPSRGGRATKMLGIITVDDVLEMLVPDRGSLETFANLFVSKRTMK